MHLDISRAIPFTTIFSGDPGRNRTDLRVGALYAIGGARLRHDQPPFPALQNVSGPHPCIYQNQLTQGAAETHKVAREDPNQKYECANGCCREACSMSACKWALYAFLRGRLYVMRISGW